MLKEELKLYNQLLEVLNGSRSKVLNNLLKGKEPSTSLDKPKDLKTDVEPQVSKKRIQFTDLIPEFIGKDLKTYGPFKKEEISSLPEEIATLLVTRKKAIEVK